MSNNYYLVKNGDVVMDTHFILPETIESAIDENILKVLSEKTHETLILSVLHPRRTVDKPCNVNLLSVKNSVINLIVGFDKKEKNIKIDLENQKVRLF